MDEYDARSAARVYLHGLGITERSYPTRIRTDAGRIITTAWNQVLGEVARAMAEQGLVGQYAARESRFSRKRRAYREAAGRLGAQQSRSEAPLSVA